MVATNFDFTTTGDTEERWFNARSHPGRRIIRVATPTDYDPDDYTYEIEPNTDDDGARLEQGQLVCYHTYRRYSPQRLVPRIIVRYIRRRESSPETSPSSKPEPHAEAVSWIKEVTGLPQERIAALLGVTRQTIYHWEGGEPISNANRQRLFAVRDVLQRALVRHPTPGQLVAWLDTPREADGRTPAELLEAGEIGKARLLAVSTPSPLVRRPQAWVRNPIPEAFRAGAERYQQAMSPEVCDDALSDDESEDDESI